MDSNSTVKKDLLRRKIEEYFSKNPNISSVVVKADIGDRKTIWRVVKENKAFNVIEVNTFREEFTMEAGDKDKKKGDKKDSKSDEKTVKKSVPDILAKEKELAAKKKKDDDGEKTSVKPGPGVKYQGKPMPVAGTLPVAGSPKSTALGPTGTEPAVPDTGEWPEGVKGEPASAATMTRAEAETYIRKAREWAPGTTGGKFEKTLGSTKDLSQTLRLMYDDMVKSYGNSERLAHHYINNNWAQAGVKITSKKDLLDPKTRALIAAYLYKIYPAVKGKFLERKTIKESKSLKEASVEFSNVSKTLAQMGANIDDPSNKMKLLNLINNAFGKVKDPTERAQLDAIKTLLGGEESMNVKGSMGGIGSMLQKSHKDTKGKLLTEEGDESGSKKKEPTGSEIETSDSQGAPDPEASQESEPEDQIPSPEKKKTEDQTAISRTLEGQTISGAELEITPNGGALVLDLANSTIPARLEWNRNGKIVYNYKGVPYIIKRG